MKLSIIIPMYNAEKYIAACLDSILDSDLPKEFYEVIIVDDGSTDEGPEIVQEYCIKNSNFRYLTQENQGQSVARNYGIMECHGEYVWCVDADDKVDAGELLCVFNEFLKYHELDLLAFRLSDVSEIGDFINYSCIQPAILENLVISGRYAVINGYYPSSVCAFWIRKSLIIGNNLYFKEGITHQDVELSYRLMVHANSVLFTKFAPYYYIRHIGSTSLALNPKKIIKYLCDDIVVYHSFIHLAKLQERDKELSKTISNRAQNILFNMLLTLYRNKKEWIPLGINRTVIEEMKTKNLYPVKGNFDNWKKKMLVLFLNNEHFIL